MKMKSNSKEVVPLGYFRKLQNLFKTHYADLFYEHCIKTYGKAYKVP
jgi:hypothetical protein